MLANKPFRRATVSSGLSAVASRARCSRPQPSRVGLIAQRINAVVHRGVIAFSHECVQQQQIAVEWRRTAAHRPWCAPPLARLLAPQPQRGDADPEAVCDCCEVALARCTGQQRTLSGLETVSDLAARHGVSRKFVYQQTHKARAALDDAFSPATPDSEVLFELAVTKAWLRQVIVALALIGRSAYRGVVEFLRDLLGVPVSLGSVHDVLEAATQQASAINQGQDLSRIRVGLHDELFQGATPVLAGVDAASTSCYLLVAEDRRDADTWGVHLLDAAAQGPRPAYTIADAGQGLRAG